MDNLDNMDTKQSKPKDIKSIILGNDIFDLSVSHIMLLNGMMILLNLQYYGANRLYWFSGCYLLLLTCVVWCAAAFFKKLKRREVKARNVITVMIVFALLVMWSFGEAIYAKDIFGGTETIITEYYRPSEKSILIDQEFDGIEYKVMQLNCTEKLSAPILENFSFDKSLKLKVSDHISVYKSSPKIEIKYYPNSKLIKEINILEE